MATPGVQAVRLGWRASPGAVRYDVYEQSAGLIGSTQQSWFIDGSLLPDAVRHYSVTAVADAGTVTATLSAQDALLGWSSSTRWR